MMGLLNDILSTVDNAKRNLSTNFFDAITNPKEWGNMMAARMQENRYGGPEEAAAMKGYLSRQPYDKEAYARANDTLTNNAINDSLGAITVWHGSPHKFNKFDMSKIGTGEGAQAYGHGLYMAEAPDVAKSYQQINWHNIAKNGGNVELNGKPVEFNTYGNPIGDIDKSGKNFLQRVAQTQDVQKAIDVTKQSIEEMRGLAKTGFVGADSLVADLEDQLAFAARHNIKPTGQPGAMYKVDIPDEAVSRFLDWDKPLSQQAPEVQAAIKNAGLVDNGQWGIRGKTPVAPNNATGSDLWTNYMQALDANGGGDRHIAPEVSAMLNKAGIPGIRYLDGGSRSAGQGSSNFVLFDDQMPRILEINGTPTGLQPWKPGEWRGLLGE